MKQFKLLLFAALLLGGCVKATLIDGVMTEFTATASQDLEDRIAVEWITNAFYQGYQVMRSETSNGTYTPVSPMLSSSTFDDITNDQLLLGKTYFYKVRGYNNLGIPLFTTAAVEGVAGSAAFSPPTTLKVSSGESGSKIVLRWQRVDGATGYRILRSREQNPKSWPILADNYPYLEYEDDRDEDGLPLNAGDVYYYRVASLDADGIPSQNSFPYNGGMRGQVFGGYAGFTSEAGKYDNKVVLSWNQIPSVKEYIIYRSEARNNLGEVITRVPSGSSPSLDYTDASVLPSKVYYYTIMFQGENSLTIQQGNTVKSYLKVASAPGQPQNFTVSQGEDAAFVRLSWDAVPGATGYEVSRSASPDGPWDDLTLAINPSGSQFTAKDDPYADASAESFSYYYRVVALNPAPGEYSPALQGWANKAPVNITASKNFGGRVLLAWDSVPRAVKYLISYSEAAGGPYTSAGELTPRGGAREEFSHRLEIFPAQQKIIYYKVSVETAGGSSDPSSAVAGMISKIGAPENLNIRNNRTSTQTKLTMVWDNVPNASGYRIYRATLMHRHATVAALKTSDYTPLADIDNNAFEDTLISYPLRRYDYKIVALDGDGAEGAAAFTGEAYRLPVDHLDFMKDVDKTIVEAQTRIGNFGGLGSEGNPKGRASGDYYYLAGTSAVSSWRAFTSFEISLTGSPGFGVNTGDMSATQSGPVEVGGLYNGTVIYNSLKGAIGGFTTGGSITVVYKGSSRTFNYTELSGLDNIVLLSESKPGYPSYTPGGGGAIQPGWSR